MLEGEITDEEQKIQSSLMHLKGRAPGKAMAPLNETKTVKKNRYREDKNSVWSVPNWTWGSSFKGRCCKAGHAQLDG